MRNGLSANRFQPYDQTPPELIFEFHCYDQLVSTVDLHPVSTISTHLTNIKGKLKARSIGDIINYAHRVRAVE